MFWKFVLRVWIVFSIMSFIAYTAVMVNAIHKAKSGVELLRAEGIIVENNNQKVSASYTAGLIIYFIISLLICCIPIYHIFIFFAYTIKYNKYSTDLATETLSKIILGGLKTGLIDREKYNAYMAPKRQEFMNLLIEALKTEADEVKEDK